MRVILSFLASVLVVFSFIYFAAFPSLRTPLQLVNSQSVQTLPVVVLSPPVIVSSALKRDTLSALKRDTLSALKRDTLSALKRDTLSVPKQEVPAPVPEATNEVFKCKENGHVTYSTTPCAGVVVAYNAKRASFADTSHSISIARNAAGHYIAQGVADGQALKFMIDTGATGVALPGGFIRGRRICEDVGVIHTAGGIVSTCVVTLKRLNLAGMDFYNVRAQIMPTLEGEGLFGQSLLNQLKVTQSGGYMTLSR